MRDDATFIGIEVDDSVVGDADLAQQARRRPARSTSSPTPAASVEIVHDNVDECILCELCIHASPAGHRQGAQALLGRGPRRLFLSCDALRRRPRSAALMRLGYRVAYRLLQVWTFAARARACAATMVAVRDGAGRVLLVRHTYGDRAAWELPGGWMHARRGRRPTAARREVAEELGIDVVAGRRLGRASTATGTSSASTCRGSRARWPGGRGTLRPRRDRRGRVVRRSTRSPDHARAGDAREVLEQLERAPTLVVVPELPEVERARALIAERALGRRIAAVDDSDTYVCRPHAPGELSTALVGRDARPRRNRIGKSMWVETDGGPGARAAPRDGGADRRRRRLRRRPRRRTTARRVLWDRFTLDVRGRRAARAARQAPPRPRGARPRPRRASAPTPPRSRATTSARASAAARAAEGADHGPVGHRRRRQPARRRGAVARAACRPLRPAGELSDDELDALRREVRAATRSAIKKGGVHTGELIVDRGRGQVCPRCGTELRRETVGGRTTYWCPAEQS